MALSVGSGLVQNAFSQVKNYHSGNKFRITFSNDGATEGEEDVTAEWPTGTGHDYLNFATPVVAVTSGGSPRIATFSLVQSFTSDGNTVAMSHDKDSWPASWPDKSAAWDGQWNGFFGRDQFTADQESFFVLEDQALGLRLTIRGWQWSHFLAQDMIFWYYEITNTGSTSYDQAAVGFFADPDIGGDGDQDQFTFDLSRSQVTAIDPDNAGRGRGVARDIGSWSPVGRLSVALLETPGIANDGIDNDGDGLIDESRSDGIDNDGDWVATTDDVGADGVADSGDEGEGDGVPTPGEPNFDATDIDESDQVGLTSFAAFPEGGLDLNNANAVWAALATSGIEDPGDAGEFTLGSSGFSLAPGETQRFSTVVYLSVNENDQRLNESTVAQIYQSNYRFPIAPPRPHVRVVAEDKRVTLYWGNDSESALGFEGYKIYRSTDPGFNDVFTVTGDRGVPIYSKIITTFDLDNEVSDLFGLQVDGFRYFLGKNTGLEHWWTDTDVDNGKTYYYAVVAFDRGDVQNGEFPAESPKSIVVAASGTILSDVNTVVARPTVETSVFQSPDFAIDHTAGIGTGRVQVEVIDRTTIKDGGRYQLTFDDTSFSNTRFSLFDVTDPGNRQTVFANSDNFSTDEQRNNTDPIFDGLHTFLFDQELAWDSLRTEWKVGDSNWSLRMVSNSNLGSPTKVPADYEVRFGEVGIDTAIFTTPFPIPFQIWNVTDNTKQNIVILDSDGDGAWNSGDNIFLVTGTTVQDFRPVLWTIIISAPSDGVPSVPPESGDIAFMATSKPFSARDVYTITSTAISAVANVPKSALDKVAAVPNPYIVNSSFEQLSLFTGGRLQRRLQFIHLPPRCTIRIFDIRGRLLRTLEHASGLDDGSAFWDLQTDENDVVAYGIYVYHIEAPGIGEKIDRFAIIR